MIMSGLNEGVRVVSRKDYRRVSGTALCIVNVPGTALNVEIAYNIDQGPAGNSPTPGRPYHVVLVPKFDELQYSIAVLL